MENTFFSFVMAIFWSSFYIFLVHHLRKKDQFVLQFQTLPLLFFLFLSITRLFFTFEARHPYVIYSDKIYPPIYDLFRKNVSLFSFEVNPIRGLVFIWFLVALFLLLYKIFVYTSLKTNLNSLEDLSSQENKDLYAKLLKENGLQGKIQVVQNESIQSPFIFGIRRGTIFIPNLNLSQEKLGHILSHEINHFKRRDSWKKLALLFSGIVFWWNPLLGLLSHNFNHFLEIQCDQITARNYTRSEKEDYIKTMLYLIKNKSEPEEGMIKHEVISTFVSMSPSNDLRQRFHILRSVRTEKKKTQTFLACLLGLVFFLSSYFVTIQPEYWPKNMENYFLAEDLGIEEEEYFILETEDGQYELYKNGSFDSYVRDLTQEKYKGIEIYKGLKEEEE